MFPALLNWGFLGGEDTIFPMGLRMKVKSEAVVLSEFWAAGDD